jgi:WXG100 family type VII secretion target
MPDVRMNYNSMETMERAFNGAHRQVDDSIKEMKNVAKSLEDGALQGGAGDAFRDAINSKLIPRMQAISDKLAELEQDVKGALEATRDGVTSAQSRFK